MHRPERKSRRSINRSRRRKRGQPRVNSGSIQGQTAPPYSTRVVMILKRQWAKVAPLFVRAIEGSFIATL